LFLTDVRAYREAKLAGTGITPLFPLWGRPTAALARDMIAAGQRFDDTLLADLPADADPCGENGEFHTCVVGGPMFTKPLDVIAGETVTRDGFAFADLISVPR
jgi:diphthamide synthase (EF-2-diphthine--ammonia ligase)